MNDKEQQNLKVLAKRVLNERLGRGLSQRELAKETGMSPDTIGRIETGDEKVGWDKLEALAVYFGASITDLLTPFENSMPALEELSSESQRKIFARNLKNIAAKKGFTPASLALRAELNLDTVRSYFAGARSPTSTSLHKLVKALSIEPTDLFRPDNKLNPPLPKASKGESLSTQKLELMIRDLSEKLNLMDERMIKNFTLLEATIKQKLK